MKRKMDLSVTVPLNGATRSPAEKTFIPWPDIYAKLSYAPAGKLYGVPRGGQIVAGLTGRATDRIEEADVIVDDIIDSGATRDRYAKWGKPFWALVDKTQVPNGSVRPWYVFPWEVNDSESEIEDTVVRQLEWLGENPARDGLKDTPRRVIKSLKELTRGYADDPQAILSKVFSVPCDEMVVLRDMEFWSLCEHHLLPFHGRAYVGYVPDQKVVGISKLARLVDCFSRRLQVQERLTGQIADAVQSHLKPKGVGVVIRATHMCMAMRGVQKPADMVTSSMYGVMRDDPRARAEFLSLVHNLAP